MSEKDQLLSVRNDYPSITLVQNFSDEEMARDWTLLPEDKTEIIKYRKNFRLFIAIQLCSLRLYGRFLAEVQDLSPRIVNYLNMQLGLPPVLSIMVPTREATFSEQRANIMNYLGFSKYDKQAQALLRDWLIEEARQGALPNDLFLRCNHFLLAQHIALPGPSILERQVASICAKIHQELFESLYVRIPDNLKKVLDNQLLVSKGRQHSFFYMLKESPPSASISTIQNFLQRYQALAKISIDSVDLNFLESAFRDYLYKLTRRYDAKDMKRFKKHKRYSMMLCFFMEARKSLLDNLVKMHDQYIMELLRKSRRVHEKKHRELRKRQKKAIDTVLQLTTIISDWPDNKSMSKAELLQEMNEQKLSESINDLNTFKQLEECGYGSIILRRYPSLRKYFSTFLELPFEAKLGTEPLLKAINIIRQLDNGRLKSIPDDAPDSFMPKELRRFCKNKQGEIQRNAWETGVAIALKDGLRSGDIFLPNSKQHVSFWDLLLDEGHWGNIRESAHEDLQLPFQDCIKNILTGQFQQSLLEAQKSFPQDKFARIINGKLKLKKYDKAEIPDAVWALQKVIDASMPSIRIEQLLIEVDKQTHFSRHFLPVQQHKSRPKNFYKTLIAALISQATNLGVVSMSSSVKELSVDMLRHVLQFYVREETIKAASAELVNQHHLLPFSKVHGDGTLSSSDAQRFKIRADSLLASYYPRYYGYYEKAIGIYTHASDQYSVYNTQVISCNPREALYVLDGLLENNSILKIRQHTTDTHGYTEIIFSLCYLLSYYFMPRIRDLKDQQLYRIDKETDCGDFAPLLNKTVDLEIIEEQWETMIRVAQSLKQKTASAHVIVQRLTSNYPSDRLSKAFTNLGRIIKTEYILRYITDSELRQKVQLQLNKGEYRHKIPRWIFFANQEEFTTADYEEIMNKSSCLSLVSNAILYWNTSRISATVDALREQGENIDDDVLKHISLLPYKHVLPNGTYFIDEEKEQ